MPKGKFIALYGVNNLGKTTQARLLVDRLKHETGSDVVYLKYPLYDLEPTGPIINGYLREGNPYQLDAQAFQLVQVINREHYNNEIKRLIASGTHIVAEDYRGTGIAWGMGAGINKDLLVALNSKLVDENVAILIDGERFLEAQEADHKHETDHDLADAVRSAHQELAKDFDWKIVGANDTIEKVHESIYTIVSNYIT